jgi:nucleoside-diphosphate-sugar epimerase
VAALLAAPAWQSRVYNASCGRAYTFAEVVAAFEEHGLQARWLDAAGEADIAMQGDQARRPLDNRSLQRDAGMAPGSSLEVGLREWLAATKTST